MCIPWSFLAEPRLDQISNRARVRVALCSPQLESIEPHGQGSDPNGEFFALDGCGPVAKTRSLAGLSVRRGFYAIRNGPEFQDSEKTEADQIWSNP